MGFFLWACDYGTPFSLSISEKDTKECSLENTQQCAWYMAANTEKCLRICITLSSSNEKLVKLHFSIKMILVAS